MDKVQLTNFLGDLTESIEQLEAMRLNVEGQLDVIDNQVLNVEEFHENQRVWVIKGTHNGKQGTINKIMTEFLRVDPIDGGNWFVCKKTSVSVTAVTTVKSGKKGPSSAQLKKGPSSAQLKVRR
jgi:ribosomal protein S4E